MFGVAVAFAAGTALWGLVIAPFNRFDADHSGAIAEGVALSGLAMVALVKRRELYGFLRRHQGWLLAIALLGVAALWLDGGWRSSYYLASYAAIGLAAVVGNVRWALFCAGILAVGYVMGLAVHGYTWHRLDELKDADSVVANTGGYLIAAVFFALPVTWLTRYVASIHQVVGAAPAPEKIVPGAPVFQQSSVTARLTAREIQVVQGIAAGLTNEQIAQTLVVSARTIQSHIDRGMKKTGAKNRAHLAALAVRDGLVVPPEDEDDGQT